MAPDSWHHLEGTYPVDGVFRVHLYDNFSQPLSAKGFQGRIVLEETFDPGTRETREIVSYPLLPSPDGSVLEARVPSGSLPIELAAKIQFQKDGPFERFDFVFQKLSSEEGVAAPTAANDFAIPDEPREMAAAILDRERRVEELLARGGFNEIYVPALEAKDLALALEDRAHPVALAWALKELVRAAWLLDDYGDLGNKEKISVAFDSFQQAARQIAYAYGVKR
jgi:hypothetical protein